jgi:hypothetical protein
LARAPDAFVAETDRVFDLLDGVMPEIAWLDDSQTLTYLHATVSTRRYRVGVPEVPFHIDALLTDSALVGGLAPMLGDQHLRVVSVRGFPDSTWPGILDDLNRLGFAYRWSTRFLCLDKAEAEKELSRLRRQWFAKRKNVIALLRETIFQQESPLVDTDASNKAADADAALQELGSDQVAFGYVTATVTVLDADAAVADEKLRMVERVIQGRGFVTIPETLNAVDAWLSSIPGNAYANVRQPIVSTLNLAHMMPVSAVWAGPGAQCAPRRPAADRHAHRRRDAVPAGDAHRRRGPHAGGWPHRHGQVGAARHAGDAVPPLSRLAHLRLRHGALDPRHHPGPGRRALRPGRGWRDRLPAAGAHRPRGLPHLGSEWVEGRLLHEAWPSARTRRRPSGLRWGAWPARRWSSARSRACRCCCNRTRCARRSRPTCWAARTASCWTPTMTASARPTCRLRDGGADAQQGRCAGGAALPVRALRGALRWCAHAADP